MCPLTKMGERFCLAAELDSGATCAPLSLPHREHMARSTAHRNLHSHVQHLSLSDDDDDDDQYDEHQENQWFTDDRAVFGGACKSVSLKKLESRIVLDKYSPNVSARAANELAKATSLQEAGQVKIKDKQDRATVEQVLDPRTRMILLKLLNRGTVESIDGCVSTGKEANVYHATMKDGSLFKDIAIKIYKTSILTFKDRDKYVSGEFRFRHGYCRHNPRKMVRTWAEKEMRNLSRVYDASIPCPKPLLLRSHVLLMQFIGSSGIPAPLLKDADFSDSKAHQLYLDCVHMVRNLYTRAKLVHADLSEFNLLYHQGTVYVIDVSQSVEMDHPRSLYFLKKDCHNINSFFRKFGVPTLSLKELFDFVTDPNINDSNEEEYLEKAQEIAAKRSFEVDPETQKIEDETFLESYIPGRLEEVCDYENDHQLVQESGEKLIYHTITSLKPDLSGPQTKPALLAELQESNSSESASNNESSDEDEDENKSENENDAHEENKSSKHKSSARPKDEDAESKKERKKAVKEANRQRREKKMPKHIKRKLVKAGKGKN